MSDALTLSSERFTASGGIEASGVRRLLGKPRLPHHEILLREAGQNSLDAAVASQGEVRFHVGIRTLAGDEAAALAARVFGRRPAGSASADLLGDYLDGEALQVLEIADYGTRGLGGPTRADVPVTAGDHADFVNFIRNIGAPRDQAQGGGTYGYGKSSLYVASGCSTILVDSLAQTSAGEERRLIACQLGEAYSHDGMRRTGRHWWGAPSDEVADFVEPVTGEAADDLARALGLPPRSAGDTGTTVMILAPVLPAEGVKDSLGAFAEALLWNFWPRMLQDGRPPRLVCTLSGDGEPFVLPSPEDTPPLDLFVEAYRTLKSGGDGSRDICSGRPARQLGRLCIRRGIRNPRRTIVAPEVSLAPRVCAHIAVMRPVELVVRYYEGAVIPGEALEWAGVFICDDAPDIEEAFAAAEPPAHDDWDPAQLARGSAKTFVNVAVREIRRAANEYALPAGPRPGTGEAQPSLARAADLMGGLLGGLGEAPRGRRGGVRAGRRSAAAGPPAFVRLQSGDEGPEAVFSVRLVNRASAKVTVSAVPGLVLDGAISDTHVGPEGQAIEVRNWTTPDGEVVATGPELELASGFDGELHVTVTLPPLSAVGIAVRVAGGEV